MSLELSTDSNTFDETKLSFLDKYKKVEELHIAGKLPEALLTLKEIIKAFGPFLNKVERMNNNPHTSRDVDGSNVHSLDDQYSDNDEDSDDENTDSEHIDEVSAEVQEMIDESIDSDAENDISTLDYIISVLRRAAQVNERAQSQTDHPTTEESHPNLENQTAETIEQSEHIVDHQKESTIGDEEHKNTVELPSLVDLKEKWDSINKEYRSTRKGCEHYERNCQIKAPCCDKYFSCWRCHDEEVIAHQIPRDKVNTIKCLNCNTEQSAKEICEQCGIRFGEYYCSKCILYGRPYIDTADMIYHCDGCGICRVGNPELYYHCDCGLCILKSERGNHICKANMSHRDCPICLEDLHTSRSGIVWGICGHLLHSTCMDGLIKNGQYKCPTCMKCLIKIETYNSIIERTIAINPMPSQFERKAKIICNQCSKYSITDYHFVGMKCGHCQAYNTTEVQDIPAHRAHECVECERANQEKKDDSADLD